MDEQGKILHIVMFPWLAIGHLRPFFQLSKYLAKKGHKISFISSPRNLQRAVKVPQDLCHLITLIAIPLPAVEHLPASAESSMDVPHVKQQLLKVALDLLEPEIRSFLENSRPKPDWIVYDYASHWLPKLARELGASTAYFSLFTAAFMAFFGSPSSLIDEERGRTTAEDYTVVPEWIPPSSGMAFRLHEMTRNMEKDADGNEYDSGTNDTIRFALSIDRSDIVIFRSCYEFEPDWFDIVRHLYQRPVFPVGVLPSVDENDDDTNTDAEWLNIKEWLDLQKENSLLYVALGTEVVLTKQEAQGLALGLEESGLPFFWVLNRSFENLPEGFRDRVAERGMAYSNWAPQIKILSHPSVGGFLTHCGWNSATEALGFGRVLILFPVMNDQGLNARLLKEKNVGIEIERDEKDGSFTSGAVADTIRLALVGEEGRYLRENARKMTDLFGSQSRSSDYVDTLVHHMMQRRELSHHNHEP